MKRLFVILAVLIFGAVNCFAADPAFGIWKSIDDQTGEVTAVWKIYEQGGQLFGTIAAVVDKPQDVIATACKTT